MERLGALGMRIGACSLVEALLLLPEVAQYPVYDENSHQIGVFEALAYIGTRIPDKYR